MVEDGLEILPTTVGYDMMENAFLSWLRGGRRKRERTERGNAIFAGEGWGLRVVADADAVVMGLAAVVS